MRSRRTWLILATFAAIVAAAAILRFWDLATNPGGLYGDEAAEGLDAARMLTQPGFHPDFLVWFPSDAGREALFAYVVALVYHFFGISVLALRATSAAFGIAGVIGIGMLGRRFGTLAGLTAAAWAAGSLWLIVVSRDGTRNMIVPVFGALALGALILWSDRPSRRVAVLAGAAIAISALYTYQPLKLLILLVPLWLIWIRRADRPTFERMRPGLPAFAAAFLIAAGPMIAVAITETSNYFGRIAQVSAVNPGARGDTDSLLIHTLRTIAMFGFTGDGNGRQDVASLPLLPIPLALLAAVGVWRLWRRRHDPAHALILISLPVFMIAPLAATEGWSPHFLRSLGLAVPLGIALGLGAVQLFEFGKSHRGLWGGRIAAGTVAVALVAVGVWSGAVYLSRPVADRYEPYSYKVTAAGDFVAAHPGSALVLDGFSAVNVQLEQYGHVPPIFDTSGLLPDARRYTYVVGLTKWEVERAVAGQGLPAAVPVAWDPTGQPQVWAIAASAVPPAGALPTASPTASPPAP
jgi:hypothetical protein